MSFALLVLALTGYCGLPSNPPSDLFQAQWLRLASAAHAAAPRQLVAPTQTKEHRHREDQAVDAAASGDAPGGGKALAVLPAVPLLAERPPTAQRHGAPLPAGAPARAATAALSRAPPAA